MLLRFAIPMLCAVGAVATTSARGQSSFVNWENAHVHPLDMTPDGTKLLAVNTADNRLEVFDLTSGSPQHMASIPVGLDPVSVRARGNTEAWVVNHISDSVSVVDLLAMNVVRSIRTDDEPADVVFAGTPRRAFVSCSQTNTVLVMDPDNPNAPIVPANPGPPQPVGVTLRISIIGEDPRALAVSPNGNEVYVAVFESGNNTTILAGGSLGGLFGADPVNDELSPYFDPDQPFQRGVNPPNPPPNDGDQFFPPIAGGLPVPPPVGLIVRKNAMGQWIDDNDHDWTNMVSGADAAVSGRLVGWDLRDHDVAIIATNGLGVRYARGLMNICMALSVNPGSGRVTVVGTEATNEIRFEPVVNGRFLRVNLGSFNPAGPANTAVVDLNDHLVYTDVVPFVPIPQIDRNQSIGDPRGIAWNAVGSRGYVTGMGSNNVVVIAAGGVRAVARPIPVGEGPTGIVLDEARSRLYVLNKFEASISVIDTTANAEIGNRVPLYDPTPPAIRTGRKHLYDTHLNSGLGHLACASCHVDSRIDRLAWDLGNPIGAVKDFNQNCNALPGQACNDWHPMKGPMTSQTLQDIIGNEPHHWRGDRDGIEEFADAFRDLLGDDQPLNDADMQEFEDFLATIHFPPNPFRNFDNTLPTSISLTGHFASGRFFADGGLPAGAPMPNGNAVLGLNRYRGAAIDGPLKCVTCHTLPTGMGPDGIFVPGPGGLQFVPLPPGPNNEHHLMITSADGSTNRSIKVPHLRNQYEKVGFDTTQMLNTAGFGFLHDGSVDSIVRFLTVDAFDVVSDQEVAHLTAFMLAFSGSDLPSGAPNDPLEPPGVDSQDTHAAVGWQTTLIDASTALQAQLNLITNMINLAEDEVVGLVVKGKHNGIARGYFYAGGGQFQSDRLLEVLPAAMLQQQAAIGSELTYTVVPKGSEVRVGVDRDEDGFFDQDEIDGCANPADPDSVPPLCITCSVNEDCDDGDPCNGVETCNNGICVPGAVSPDCNNNDIVDSCETDCNDNNVPDECDISSGASTDINSNGIPDECEPICGGIAGISCGPGEFCKFPPGTCDIVDNAGVCMVIPQGCPDNVDPVCGCDGVTYNNACEADAAQESLAHTGACVEGCGPVSPPLPDGDVAKNRYLSFRPGVPAQPVAIRVTFVDLNRFGGFNGEDRWVGPESIATDGSAGGFVTIAPLQCTPHCSTWSGIDVLNAFAPAVVPGSEYLVQIIDCGCDFEDEDAYSAGLTVLTQKWGDIEEPFGGISQPNFLDISTLVDAFRAAPGAVSVVRADLQPNNPNQVANFADISVDVDAFRGFVYAFPGPVPCP